VTSAATARNANSRTTATSAHAYVAAPPPALLVHSCPLPHDATSRAARAAAARAMYPRWPSPQSTSRRGCRCRAPLCVCARGVESKNVSWQSPPRARRGWPRRVKKPAWPSAATQRRRPERQLGLTRTKEAVPAGKRRGGRGMVPPFPSAAQIWSSAGH
jgi:hypothetical protein